MNSKKITLRSSKLHVAIGAVALGLLVTPLAVAGAAEGPSAASSGAATSKVKKQLRKLQLRVAQLEANGATPSGPAGGDLTGEYPEPVIAPDAVGSEEVINGSLNADDIVPDSLGAGALALDSGGSSELKGVTARVGNGAGSNNTYVNASVTCAPGEMVVGGGHAWTNDADVTIVASAPDEGSPNTTWVVRGKSPTANTLFAWANCLQV